ncbi:helix-turn-helix domain-containing protein [Neomicrococcus lactis]|uniref:helix-turn-helix domain-containing protein n=1 Tax=Neomicrococcus lactis TaxID=732241 RepID=UPI002300384D|nr:helix-turn-helix domain-containing protein [Neomicrococcus lactis]
MALTLAQLLAVPDLGLTLVPTLDGADPATIRLAWAAVTEQLDPAEFLTGGEVLLTTGTRLRTTALQRNFVLSAHRGGAAALGFGVGLGHNDVPAALRSAAAEVRLPLFEVPYETAFAAISRLMAEDLAADHVAGIQQLLTGHQKLSAALLRGGGINALLDVLEKYVGGAARVEQYGIELGASSLASTAIDRELSETQDSDDSSVGTGNPAQSAQSGWSDWPIASGLRDRASLFIREPLTSRDLVPYAQSLLGLELSNQARLRRTSRIAAGQVLDDIIHGGLHGHDASLRMQSIGLDAMQEHSVVLVQSDQGLAPLAEMPLPTLSDRITTAILDDRLAVIVPADGSPSRSEPRTVAQQVARLFKNTASEFTIGFGRTYPDASGLRLSYYEARESLRSMLPINEPSRLSLTSLLLTAKDVPLMDLAREILEPLEFADSQQNGELIETLRRFLHSSGEIGQVARELGIHRNTVRYRLQRVADLTGYSPANMQDRVQLWLALEARDLS